MLNIRYMHLLMSIFICLLYTVCPSMPVSHPVTGEEERIVAPPLAGCVRDDQGKPLVDVFIATKILTPGVPLPTIAVVTDETGCYTHDTLYPGTYEISITVEGYQPAIRRVEIFDGQTITLDFVLQPAR
jgi:hypothetical protein